MKPFHTMSGLVAVALSVGLLGCGGGGSRTYVLGGVVLGPINEGLTLTNGATTIPVTPSIAGSQTFEFPERLSYGTVFNVKITTQPAHETCLQSSNFTGSAGTTSTSNVVITCSINQFTIGGTISGLTTTGLILNNGADQLPIAAATTTFTLPTQINDGASYGVTVLQQPTGQICSISNGTGSVPAAAVTSIQVVCR